MLFYKHDKTRIQLLQIPGGVQQAFLTEDCTGTGSGGTIFSVGRKGGKASTPGGGGGFGASHDHISETSPACSPGDMVSPSTRHK